MFFGRETELSKLTDMYQSGHFEFAVIYGRRRVGKTTLIREFIKNKNAIFFAANESTARDNLISFSRQIGKKTTSPVFSDFESALTEVFDKADNDRLILVIDEFPYLAESYQGISSVLQILIDHRKENSKLMLILCGSSMSFMEEQVLGSKSPLFGRRSAQFKIQPFTFFEALPFLDAFDPVQKSELYGITGGIPEYLNKINPGKSVANNIMDLFLTTSGLLFEEPANLLKQELREPSTYNVIIESIAQGASRLNEVATKAGIESNKCAKYLKSLISLGLIRREYPYGEKTGKRSIYRLEDQMYRFWYRFVFPNMSGVVAGLGEGVYKNEIEPLFNTYMGLIFEDICKQFLFLLARDDELPFFTSNFGRWWGTNTATKSQEEIDIISVSKNNALFAECKWINVDVTKGVLEELVRRSNLFSFKDKHYYIFTKKKVDSKKFKATRAQKPVHLYSISEMIAWYESRHL